MLVRCHLLQSCSCILFSPCVSSHHLGGPGGARRFLCVVGAPPEKWSFGGWGELWASSASCEFPPPMYPAGGREPWPSPSRVLRPGGNGLSSPPLQPPLPPPPFPTYPPPPLPLLMAGRAQKLCWVRCALDVPENPRKGISHARLYSCDGPCC